MLLGGKLDHSSVDVFPTDPTSVQPLRGDAHTRDYREPVRVPDRPPVPLYNSVLPKPDDCNRYEVF